MDWRWLLVVPGACHALAGVAAEFTLSDLMQALARVPSAQTRFTETKQLAMLETPLVLQGRLSYTRPDRLEKHILTPYNERTLITGDTVTIENRTRNRTRTLSLKSTPAILTFVESLRATLSGDLAALERHYLVHFEGPRDNWTLVLKPKEPDLAALVASIRLAGKDELLSRVEIEEIGGDLSVMLLSREKP